ncbi:MAG: cation transporter [Candidatus Coatesbacteria bacterium]|nr:MAG: cation transporter [Candidatus Coatesbacteria bacterium]
MALTGLVLVGEVVGGILSGSLALLSDAAHVFMDLFALGLTLGAALLARLGPDDRRTFGWHRAEVFAALANSLSLFVIIFIILREAYFRIKAPTEVHSLGLLIVASVGLVVNLIVALGLRGHAHADINIRGAFLHVLGDAGASVAVIAGGVIIALTGWNIVDPILSVGIGLLLFWGAGRLFLDAFHIFIEGTPRGISPRAVAEAINGIDGVQDVHNLHIWSICSHISAISVHCRVDSGRGPEVTHAVAALVNDRFGISHATVQTEEAPCKDTNFYRKLEH